MNTLTPFAAYFDQLPNLIEDDFAPAAVKVSQRLYELDRGSGQGLGFVRYSARPGDIAEHTRLRIADGVNRLQQAGPLPRYVLVSARSWGVASLDQVTVALDVVDSLGVDWLTVGLWSDFSRDLVTVMTLLEGLHLRGVDVYIDYQQASSSHRLLLLKAATGS